MNDIHSLHRLRHYHTSQAEDAIAGAGKADDMPYLINIGDNNMSSGSRVKIKTKVERSQIKSN